VIILPYKIICSKNQVVRQNCLKALGAKYISILLKQITNFNSKGEKMTLKNLSDKEIKTINGGAFINFCGYGCGRSFTLINTFLSTLENMRDIYRRVTRFLS